MFGNSLLDLLMSTIQPHFEPRANFGPGPDRPLDLDRQGGWGVGGWRPRKAVGPDGRVFGAEERPGWDAPPRPPGDGQLPIGMPDWQGRAGVRINQGPAPWPREGNQQWANHPAQPRGGMEMAGPPGNFAAGRFADWAAALNRPRPGAGPMPEFESQPFAPGDPAGGPKGGTRVTTPDGRVVVAPWGTGHEDPAVTRDRDFAMFARDRMANLDRLVAGLAGEVRRGRMTPEMANNFYGRAVGRITHELEGIKKFKGMGLRDIPQDIREHKMFRVDPDANVPPPALPAPPVKGGDQVGPDGQVVPGKAAQGQHQANPLNAMLGLQALEHLQGRHPWAGVAGDTVRAMSDTHQINRDQELSPRPWGVQPFPMMDAFQGYGDQIQHANRMGMDINRGNQAASVALKTAYMNNYPGVLQGQAALENAKAQNTLAGAQANKTNMLPALLGAMMGGGFGQGGGFGGGDGFLNRKLPMGVNLNLPYVRPFPGNFSFNSL